MNHNNNSQSLRTTDSALNPNETKSNFSQLKCYGISCPKNNGFGVNDVVQAGCLSYGLAGSGGRVKDMKASSRSVCNSRN